MAEIIKVYAEDMPDVRLIGKKYTDADRDQFGTFGAKWGEWFQNGYFNPLKDCKCLEKVSDDFLGVMRATDAGFEYWIGIFAAPDAEAPNGYSYVDIPAAKLGVCYVYGKEDTGELFGMDVHNACMAQFAENGFTVSNGAWFIERYNCPRYTEPDEKGNVILDYCAYID